MAHTCELPDSSGSFQVRLSLFPTASNHECHTQNTESESDLCAFVFDGTQRFRPVRLMMAPSVSHASVCEWVRQLSASTNHIDSHPTLVTRSPIHIHFDPAAQTVALVPALCGGGQCCGKPQPEDEPRRPQSSSANQDAKSASPQKEFYYQTSASSSTAASGSGVSSQQPRHANSKSEIQRPLLSQSHDEEGDQDHIVDGQIESHIARDSRVLSQSTHSDLRASIGSQHPRTEAASQSSSAILIERPIDTLASTSDIHPVNTPPQTQTIGSSTESSVRMKIERIRDQFLESKATHNKADQYVPLFGRTHPESTTYFDVQSRVWEFLERKKQSVLLILGETGSGKSTLAFWLARLLWKARVDGDPIPLLAPLSAVHHPYRELIPEILRCHTKNGVLPEGDPFNPELDVRFSEEEIEYLQKNHRFVFLFDNYDQLDVKMNLFSENRFDQWQSQSVVFCNSSFASQNPDYRTYFTQFRDGQPDITSLQEFSVAPLTATQVEMFIDKHILSNPNGDWKEAKIYHAYINQVAGLAQLVTNPLYLHMILVALPAYVARVMHDSWKTFITISKFDLIAFYAQVMIESHAHSISQSVQPDDEDCQGVNWESETLEFYKALSYRLVGKGQSIVHYNPKNRNIYDESNEWESFFNSQNIRLWWIRKSPLMQSLGRYHFYLSHPVLTNYFASLFETQRLLGDNPQPTFEKYYKKDLSSSAISNPFTAILQPNQSLLSSIQFPHQSEFLIMMANQITDNQTLKSHLWDLVHQSTSDKSESASLLASHSITILNYAGESISNLDLAGVSIPNADLSFASMDSANLAGADLSGVNFSQAFLRGCNMSSALLSGTSFGSYPLLQHNDSVRVVLTLQDFDMILLIGGCSFSVWESVGLGKKASVKLPEDHLATSACIIHASSPPTLAIGTDNGAIFIYNIITREPIRTIQNQTTPVKSLISGRFMGNSSLLISVHAKGAISLWNSTNFELLQEWSQGEVVLQKAIAFRHHQGRSFLATCCANSTIHIRDFSNPRNVNIVSTPGRVISMCAVTNSANEVFLVCGSVDGSIFIYNTTTWQLWKRLESLGSPVLCVSDITGLDFTSWFAASTEQGRVCLYTIENADLISDIQPEASAISSVVPFLLSREIHLIVGCRSSTARIIPIRAHKRTTYSSCVKGPIHAVESFEYSGTTYCVIAADDGRLHLLDARDTRELRTYAGHTTSPSTLVTIESPGGEPWILSSSKDGSTRIWTPQDSNELWINRRFDFACSACSIKGPRREDLVALGLEDGTIRLADMQSGAEKLRLQGHQGPVRALCPLVGVFKENLLISGSEDGVIRLWDLSSGSLVKTFMGHEGPITRLLFDRSQAGDLTLISASMDSTIRTWDIGSGSWVSKMDVEGAPATDVRVLRTESGSALLLTCNGSSIVSIWDLATSTPIIRLHTFAKDVHSLSVAPNGRSFYTASRDGGLKAWSITETEIDLLVSLLWSSVSNLIVDDIQVTNARGLSPLQAKLLSGGLTPDPSTLVTGTPQINAWALDAENGDTEAQLNLATAYHHGRDVNRNMDLAIFWYKHAAKNGNAGAQTNLGGCFESGEGVEQSTEMAAVWYGKAADQGDTDAQFNLANLYLQGDGVPKDAAKAVKLLQSAAQQGDTEAQITLARVLSEGVDVAQDLPQAMVWLQKAAAEGDASALVELADLLCKGDDPNDEVKAAEYYLQAAQMGHSKGQYRYAMCLMAGKGVTVDEAEAVTWLTKAAHGEYADAQVNLGVCYESGSGVGQDYAEAVKWYSRAADQGDNDARVNLANCYRHGLGVDKDERQAAELYQTAAVAGDVEAMFHYAECYAQGSGVDQSMAEAVVWYQAGAAQDHMGCLITLADILKNGKDGVPAEPEKADALLEKARNIDPEEAERLLSEIGSSAE